MTRRLTLSLGICALVMSGLSTSSGGDRPSRADCSKCAGMTWVAADCDTFYEFFFDSRALSSLNDIAGPVRDSLNRHLTERLGRYAARLVFERGYHVDVDDYFQRHPDERRTPTWPYAYDLHFLIRFSDQGPVEYCARIGLDAAGRVLREIDLPHLAARPERGSLLSISELLGLAADLGVPVEEATLDLEYDEQADVLEYLIQYGIAPKDDGFNRMTLYVTAHDRTHHRWQRSMLRASNGTE